MTAGWATVRPGVSVARVEATLIDELERLTTDLLTDDELSRAKALIGAWTWNVRNLGELRKSRKAAQGLRRVPDVDLRSLQVRGSARVRGYVAGSLQAEDRIRTISERSRDFQGTAQSRVRSPAVIGALVFLALVLIGSRSLIFGRVPMIGQMPGWTGVGGLVE